MSFSLFAKFYFHFFINFFFRFRTLFQSFTLKFHKIFSSRDSFFVASAGSEPSSVNNFAVASKLNRSISAPKAKSTVRPAVQTASKTASVFTLRPHAQPAANGTLSPNGGGSVWAVPADPPARNPTAIRRSPPLVTRGNSPAMVTRGNSPADGKDLGQGDGAVPLSKNAAVKMIKPGDLGNSRETFFVPKTVSTTPSGVSEGSIVEETFSLKSNGNGKVEETKMPEGDLEETLAVALSSGVSEARIKALEEKIVLENRICALDLQDVVYGHSSSIQERLYTIEVRTLGPGVFFPR